MRGSLDQPGKPLARFRSAIVEEGGRESVVARIEAGRLAVNAERNLRTGAASVGGHAERITAEQKGAFLSLCRDLERSFGNLGSAMPPQKDLLVRTACYYAEAPVGHKLVDLELAPPAAASAQSGDGATGTPTPQQCVSARTSGDDPVTLRACQQNGEDGIRALECRVRNYRMYWDGDSPRRCYGYRGDRQTDCNAYRCRGRCGPDCRGGAGVYTRDCAEHDDCSYRTNASGGPRDNNCGDEFNEAANDTIQAPQGAFCGCL